MQRTVRSVAAAILAVAPFLCVPDGAAADEEGLAKAPSFQSKDMNGNAIKLEDLLGKGPILVDFWATWCKPCVEEMPRLAKWREKLGAAGKRYELSFISVDEDEADLVDFRKDFPDAPASPRLAEPAKDRLVTAAFELFEERGFEGTTVDDIAQRAGVGRTTFFRTYRSKEDVIFPEHDVLLARIDGRLAAAGPQSRTVAVIEASRIVLKRWAMIRTVLPWTRRRSASCTAASLSESSALVASSRMRIGALRRKARAMAMRCFWPPERSEPRSPTMVS